MTPSTQSTERQTGQAPGRQSAGVAKHLQSRPPEQPSAEDAALHRSPPSTADRRPPTAEREWRSAGQTQHWQRRACEWPSAREPPSSLEAERRAREWPCSPAPEMPSNDSIALERRSRKEVQHRIIKAHEHSSATGPSPRDSFPTRIHRPISKDPERLVPSAQCRVPSAECRVPSAQRRKPSAEHQRGGATMTPSTQSTERLRSQAPDRSSARETERRSGRAPAKQTA